jgi:hypothetical protein
MEANCAMPLPGISHRSSRGRVSFRSRAELPAGLSGLTGQPRYLIGRWEEDREGELGGGGRLELVSKMTM